jgi:tRNA(fMet)-specific endonuclease VapC
VNYLLDTNACIALINGEPEEVRRRSQKALAAGAELFVPAITIYELWYVVAKSSRVDFSTKRLETFLSGPVTAIPLDNEDARAAGFVRATLEVSGKLIGAYDLLIAGQALARGLTLVTANVSEFSRVQGLAFQDWGKS